MGSVNPLQKCIERNVNNRGRMKGLRRCLTGLLVVAFATVSLLSCGIHPNTEHIVSIYKDACIVPYTDYTYKTGEAITFQVDKESFFIPKGFETDLASIPRWYWTFLSPQYSAFVTPSIIHDYFYRCSNLKSRKFADEVFYYALKEKGVSDYTAAKFFLAVRLFGAHSYAKTLPCTPEMMVDYE